MREPAATPPAMRTRTIARVAWRRATVRRTAVTPGGFVRDIESVRNSSNRLFNWSGIRRSQPVATRGRRVYVISHESAERGPAAVEPGLDGTFGHANKGRDIGHWHVR